METLAPPFSKSAAGNLKYVRNCPDCKSPLQRRISRGWLVKNLIFWLPLKRYRCDKCFKAVYVRSR